MTRTPEASGWRDIASAPNDEWIIGLRFDRGVRAHAPPYFVGKLFDPRLGWLIDPANGPVVRCTHWMRPLPHSGDL